MRLRQPPPDSSQKVNCGLDPTGHLWRAVIVEKAGLGPPTHTGRQTPFPPEANAWRVLVLPPNWSSEDRS